MTREDQCDAERIRTVVDRGEAGFEVRGSTFVGHVTPVADVGGAERFVDAVAAEHPDVTHVVAAYRVRVDHGTGAGLVREWSDDAGEPSGAAGKPALNVLAKRGLENVAAVVTRRFGGTKLGIGGLARAYGRAVSLAVDDAGVAERSPRRQVALEVGYDDSGTVRGLLEAADVAFEAAYDETVRFDVQVSVDEAEPLLDRIRSATRGRARVDAREP